MSSFGSPLSFLSMTIEEDERLIRDLQESGDDAGW